MPKRNAFALLSCLLLAGCPVVDLGESIDPPGRCQPDRVAFETEIWPMAIAPADASKSCIANSGCHERASGRSVLRLISNPMSPADFAQNYNVTTSFLNCPTPSSSVFITRPKSNIDPHGGGDLWVCDAPGDAECDLIQTIEDWIANQ